MNNIRQIRELNKRELESGISPEASWHADYRDTAYIYIGGLPFELSEGDVMTIFSQFGEPSHLDLIRDKETGKSRGFAFLKYEDQRSTDLAVDNLGGIVIKGRTLQVDHTRYKKNDSGDAQDKNSAALTSAESKKDHRANRSQDRAHSDDSMRPEKSERQMIREERELALIIRDHDDEDPMKPFLIQEKKDEIAIVLARLDDSTSHKRDRESSRHHHHHHHRHRRHRHGSDDGNRSDHGRSRRKRED